MQQENPRTNNITVEMFQDIISNIDLTIFYLYADWCEICNKINKDFKELMRDYNSNDSKLLLVPENIDNSIFKQYTEFNVEVVPTFLLFKKGNMKPFQKIEGDISKVKKILLK